MTAAVEMAVAVATAVTVAVATAVTVAVGVVMAVATHAACQSWRGAKLWRLDPKKNDPVAHAKQKNCARHL